jgi:hypothetical protein
MLFTLRYCISFLLVIFLVVKAEPSGAQPSLFNRLISVDYKNLPVSVVLQKISKETGMRFSYDPEIVASKPRITVKTVNQPLSDILKTLFTEPGIRYREIGNQIVIYSNLPKEQPEKPGNMSAVVLPAKKNVPSPDEVHLQATALPDTVFITKTDTLLLTKVDTLLTTETVIQYDTVHHTDTIYLEKQSRTKKAGKRVDPGFDKNSLSNQKFKRNNGFYGGILYGQNFGKASYLQSSPSAGSLTELLKKTTAGNAANYSFGATVGYDYRMVGLQSGLLFTRLGEKFDYSFTSQIGGFYKTDTVEKYYTLSGIDTSWYYITDSSWVNVDFKEFSYKNPNSYHYLEVPLMLKLRFIQGESVDVYAMGGIIAGLYLGGKSLLITQEAGNPVFWTTRAQLNPLMLSWQAGLGASFSVFGKFSVFGEFLYRKQLKEQFKNYPVQKKFGLVNVKTGIFVRF